MSIVLPLLLALVAAGCSLFRTQHPAPVDPGATWTTHMGGPERAGFEDARAPDSTPDIVWTSDAGRGLAAAPVLTGEVLVGATTGRTVITLSAETGERYWEHGKQGPLSVSPVVDAERIYVSTGEPSGQVYALRRHDGSESWSRSHPGVDVPLLLDGNRLFLATKSGYLSALRTETGQPLWNVYLGQGATAPVLVGDRVLVGTSRDSLYAVEAETGTIVDRRGLRAQISATPAHRNGVIYLPLQNGELTALHADDLEEAWTVRADGPILAAPAIARDGSIYLLDRTGAVHLVSPQGEMRHLAAAGGAATASLALARNAILVGLVDGTLVALGRDDGELLWSTRFRDSIHSPVLVRDGEIFVPLRRGNVVKLQ